MRKCSSKLFLLETRAKSDNRSYQSSTGTSLRISYQYIGELLTDSCETKEAVLPFTDVCGPLVEAEKSGHPIGDFGAHRQEFAVEMSSKHRFPVSWRVKPVVVAGGEVYNAVVQSGSFFPLLDGLDVLAVLVAPFWSQEGFERIRDSFDLL